MQASLRLRSLKQLPSHAAAAAEMAAAGVRLNGRGNGFLLDGVDDDDSWYVHFDRRLLSGTTHMRKRSGRTLTSSNTATCAVVREFPVLGSLMMY